MLTATYSLVAIAAEQDKARNMLHRIQRYIQSTWKGLQNIDLTFLETAFNKLMQLDKYCHCRKIEVHLIPALRGVSRDADALIVELESLSVKGLNILRSVGDQFACAFDMSSGRGNEMCRAMGRYCDNLFTRLEKEEKELLPMVRRLFSIEDWFAVAARFLSDDADAYGRKRRLASPPCPIEQIPVTKDKPLNPR